MNLITHNRILPHLIILLSLTTLSHSNDCRPRSCNNGGVEVRFPFWLRNHHEPTCGHPQFELHCSKNTKQTLLTLPISTQFKINHIDYRSRTIQLQDPKICLPRQLLNLDLTKTPFGFFKVDEFFSDLGRFVFFNCSSSAIDDRVISCLGGSGFFMKAFESDEALGGMSVATCRRVGDTAEIPTALLTFQKDHLMLNWSVAPRCVECEERGRGCRFTDGDETECVDFPKQGLSEKLLTSGAILGSFFLILLPIAMYHLHRKYLSEKENEVKIKQFLEDYKALRPTRYTHADIKRITNHFKQKLGQGGYGSVYKGKLANDILVAVKILSDSSSENNGDDFINEVGAMCRIHHVNVARLVGFCADGAHRALVYEFLHNGSLEKFVFTGQLGWERVREVSLGIAKGMEYIHHGCERQILHFDIKPHNILLDDSFVPKISDFGLAKLFEREKSFVSVTAFRGTVGYIAPEVASRNFGKPSYKSDVYSFGMLLLDMVGGRKNASQVYFPEWAYQGEELGIRVEEDRHAEIIKMLTIVALKCIQWYPMDRPSMKTVVQMLEGDGGNLTLPPNPFTSGERPLNTSGLEIISETE